MYSALNTTAIGLCALLGACDKVSDSIEKNWSGNGEQPASEEGTGGSSAGSAAPPPQRDAYTYNVSSDLRGSDPRACSPQVVSLQLVLRNNIGRVSAMVSGQAWPCSDLDYDGNAYYASCLPSAPNTQLATNSGSLSVILYEPATRARVSGEATLTLSSVSGTCEHYYVLNGELRD